MEARGLRGGGCVVEAAGLARGGTGAGAGLGGGMRLGGEGFFGREEGVGEEGLAVRRLLEGRGSVRRKLERVL